MEELAAKYSGKVKVTGQQLVIQLSIGDPYIIIDVWANDLTQTTGLLAYIRNSITISLKEILKTLRKSEEVARNITQIFNYFNELYQWFEDCCNRAKVKDIVNILIKVKNGIGQNSSDHKVLSKINQCILKFQGMYEEESCIDTETVFEIEFDIIEWLKQIQKLVSYYIKTYNNNFHHIDKISEEFNIGEESLTRKIEKIEKVYRQSILNYIIIIHKDNGLTIYQEKLGGISTDPDLISGFLTAIQNFGTEITQKNTSVLGLKYRNYNIEVETWDYIQAVLLLNGKINSYLANKLLEFVKNFENQYEDRLKNFIGNVSQFSNANSNFIEFLSFQNEE